MIYPFGSRGMSTFDIMAESVGVECFGCTLKVSIHVQPDERREYVCVSCLVNWVER